MRSGHGRRLTTAALWLALGLSLGAAPVRVTTWNLHLKDDPARPAGQLPESFVDDAVRALRTLHPDVIVLQQAPDLDTCEQIARSLNPGEYSVAICSTFRDARTGAAGHQQVAILTRGRVTEKLSENWKSDSSSNTPPGGFAYATVRLDNRNFSIFSVELADSASVVDRADPAQQAAREEASRQLLRQIDALRDPTTTNQAFVVAGDFNTTPDDPALSRELTLARLERAGFASAFGSLPPDKRATFAGEVRKPAATLDYIFARDAGRMVNLQLGSAAFADHYPVTCELDSAPATPAVAGSLAGGNDAQSSSESTPSFSAFGQVLTREIGPANLWWMGGLLAGSILLVSVGAILLARGAGASGASLRPAGNSPSGVTYSSPPNSGEIVIVARSTQTGSSSVPARPSADPAPVVHVEPRGGGEAAAWQRRAEAAERRAEQATNVIRRGLLPQLAQWFKGRAVQKLVSDRERLLQVQQEAAMKMQAVDERLTRVERHIQDRTREYEDRIDELQRELEAAREENRELIRARIAQVRAEMERERARLRREVGDEF